jgi:hypothetical protein
MRATLLVAAMLGVFGCATERAPMMKLADARGEIRAAEQLDADHVPTASSYLAQARQEEDDGRRLLNVGRGRRAAYVLERAQADAELALSLATESSARADAQRALDEVQKLQDQQQEVKP